MALPEVNITTGMVRNELGENTNNVGKLVKSENTNIYGWGTAAGGERVRLWGLKDYERVAPFKLGAYRGYDHNWAHYMFDSLLVNSVGGVSYKSRIRNGYQHSSHPFIDFEPAPEDEKITVTFHIVQKFYNKTSYSFRSFSVTRELDISEIQKAVALQTASDVLAESYYYVMVSSITDSKGGRRFANVWPAPTHPSPVSTGINLNPNGWVKIDDNPGYDAWYTMNKINTTNQGLGYASIHGMEFTEPFDLADHFAGVDVYFTNYASLEARGKIYVEVQGEESTWYPVHTDGGANNDIIAAPIVYSHEITTGVYSKKLNIRFSLSDAKNYLTLNRRWTFRVVIENEGEEDNWELKMLESNYKGDLLDYNTQYRCTVPARGQMWGNFTDDWAGL